MRRSELSGIRTASRNYCTVTSTVVEIMVVPDVPVTINDAGPFGVPVTPPAPEPLGLLVPHPARTNANANAIRQTQEAVCQRGARRHPIRLKKIARIKAARSDTNSKSLGDNGGAFG